MEENSGIREDSGQQCVSSIPRIEGLAGWCENCTDDIRYHLGDDAGRCLSCGCGELLPVADPDRMDIERGHLLPKTVDVQDLQNLIGPEEIVEVTEVLDDTIRVKVRRMFWGRVSRECKRCGYQKLYREFGNSIDPGTKCQRCEFELDQLDLMRLLDEAEQEEIEEIQQQIRLNESQYESALERQYFIDQVLKDLDG